VNSRPAITAPRQAASGSLFGALFPSVTLILIVAAASGIRPETPIILVLLVVGVVILGLPHGALDPLVAAALSHAQFFNSVHRYSGYLCGGLVDHSHCRAYRFFKYLGVSLWKRLG
jgi:hypothetical protein